jgi:hypothetical protein
VLFLCFFSEAARGRYLRSAVDIWYVIQGTFSVIQGTYGVIQGTYGVIQGTYGVIQGTCPVTGLRAPWGCIYLGETTFE